MRILFLGNSFTFFNDLPQLVASLLNAEVGRSLRGGAYLYQHLDPADELYTQTNQLLTEDKWDYVVLQDQSQGPITHLAQFREAVASLCPKIKASGAKPLLYETWAYREGSNTLASTGLTFDAMQQALTDGYAAAARDFGALVAPVGQAFCKARRHTDLYCEDDYHPSAEGSRIAAQVIADTILADQAGK